MNLIAILVLSLVIVGIDRGNKIPDKKVETKTIEVVVNKSTEIKPSKKEIKPVSKETKVVKEEIKPEPVTQEVKPDSVKEEIKPDPVKEEIKPEPVKELNNSEDTSANYLRIFLYIIGAILFVSIGLYFFLRNRNTTPSSVPYNYASKNTEEEDKLDTNEPQPAEEEIQADTNEPQPAEEEIQADTNELKSVDEEEDNNNK